MVAGHPLAASSTCTLPALRQRWLRGPARCWTGCHTTFLAAAVSLPGTPEPAPVPRPCAAPCVSFRGIVHRDLKLENLLLVEPHDITHIKIAGGCQQRSRVWCWCRVPAVALAAN